MRRRGVFPIIAVLALVILGVAGGILTLKFVNPFISQLQTQGEVNNILTIEGVSLEGNTATIGITNLGTKPVKIVSVLLLDGSLNLIEKVDTSQTISPGESTTFTVTFSTTTQPGQRYAIKVLGADGSSATIASIRAKGSTAWRVVWYSISDSSGSLGSKVGEETWSTLNYAYNWGGGNVYDGYANTIGYIATAIVYFTSTSTTITTVSDDGMRVWIDGNLVNDNWGLHSARTISNTVSVTVGYHEVEVRWYEWYGSARSDLTITNAQFRP